MTARSIDWPWLLTKLAIGSLSAHFLFIIGVGFLLPVDWPQIASLVAVGLLLVAVASFLVVLWLDYRASAGGSLSRHLFESVAIGILIVAAATILEEMCSVSWWLAAAATATIVVPIWGLCPRRGSAGQPW